MYTYYEKIKEETYDRNDNIRMNTVGYFCAIPFTHQSGITIISIGISLCKKGDKFNKNIGRLKAKNRAHKNLFLHLYLPHKVKNRHLGVYNHNDDNNMDNLFNLYHKFLQRVVKKFKYNLILYPHIEWH